MAAPDSCSALRRHGLALRLHLGGVVAHQLLSDAAGFECPVGDLGNRGHLGGGPGDEALGKACEFLGHDAALDHFDIVPLRQCDRGRARYAGEEAIGGRCMDFAVLDEEDVGAGTFGDAALPVEHHGIGIASLFGAMLGDGADHVQACRLGEDRGGFRVGATVLGEIEADAFEPLRGVEIARPFPGGDGEMDFVVLRRDAELLGAAPGQRPHIGVFLIILLENQTLGGVDLGNIVGNFEIHQLRRSLETLGMLGAPENLAAIGAYALEHATRVVKAVREHADLALGGGNELAVEPDQVGTLVEGHRHDMPPWHGWPAPCRNFCRAYGGPLRSAVGFCVGTRLPVWSRQPYESAFRRLGNPAPWANQARCCCDIALLGVTIKARYVNIADVMADISLNTPRKSRSAAGPIESAAPVREPYWDLIELLFFAYRDFVGDPDQVLAKLGFGRAHHRVLHFVNRNPGMKVAELLDVLKITKQSLGRVLKQLIDEGYVVQKAGPDDRRQRLLHASPAGSALAMKLAGLQTERIGRVLDELGPGARETARRFLAGMIDAEDRERVLHLIARA